MRIPRIYQDQALEPNHLLTLDEQASHHLLRVLRFVLGDQVIVFNGTEVEFQSTLVEITKKNATVKLEKLIPGIIESPLWIHLGQAISRSAKMDMAIQKAVELGVSEITPLITERSQVKRHDSHLIKRLSHWQAIIINASEQCGRSQLPKLNQPCLLRDWLQEPLSDLNIVLTPIATETLQELIEIPKNVKLLIGAEGGLSDEEIKLALAKTYTPKKLGPRILRTETAALAAITLLQAKWGDIGF